MKRKKNKHGQFDFGIRQASRIGVLSSCLAGIEFFLFLAGVYFSYLKQGQAGTVVGVIGFGVFALAVTGTVLGVYGLTREEYHHGPDLFGAVANGVILTGICILFVSGTMS